MSSGNDRHSMGPAEGVGGGRGQGTQRNNRGENDIRRQDTSAAYLDLCGRHPAYEAEGDKKSATHRAGGGGKTTLLLWFVVIMSR